VPRRDRTGVRSFCVIQDANVYGGSRVQRPVSGRSSLTRKRSLLPPVLLPVVHGRAA
jgi:hypothetical protein